MKKRVLNAKNVYEVMKADKMVITAAAVKKLEEVYNK